MDTLTAFAMGEANRHREMMVFDWNKAARIIRTREAQSASAGLSGDWGHTGGEILHDGKPVPEDETYVYLASTWATPELEVDGDRMPCFVMQHEVPAEWGDNYAKVYWPDSAVRILAGEVPHD